MAVFLTFPTAGSYEFLAWASALLSALSDVCGAEGQAFNFVLPLFALYCEWAGSGELPVSSEYTIRPGTLQRSGRGILAASCSRKCSWP